ncbi:cytochrome P450 [Pyrenochaeta sp. DS3sAY3a]|nr:cytochrome P450 [Pyrenochaeta sp. DS3sAY3a]
MTALPESFSYFWLLATLGGLYVILKLLRFGAREKNLPPGPSTLPIIGNLHVVIDRELYKRFKEWSEKYGEVFSLKIGKGTMIVLNSKRAVHDLIDKRGAIYSSRPQDYQYHLTLKDENLVNMEVDARWRSQRKITARFFAPIKLDGGLARISEAEITTLMYDLLTNPKDFSNHFDRSTASFASIALLGQRAKSHDDFWARSGYEGMGAINAALSPGSYLPTEQFPIFKLVPKQWLSSTMRAEEAFRTSTGIWTKARELVELRRDQGDKRESLMDELLEDESIMSDSDFSGTKLANFVGALMQGAVETSALTIRTSIMFLATHPWVQEKAQKEIDALCGVNRVPTFADFKDLPYINCILKEGLRIRPVVPTGVPHRCTEDNWYDGMLIPKDATVMVPAWALGHSHYDNPEAYNPDRYLNHPGLAPEYAASSDYQNRDHYSYGSGRRLCPGIHLAERTQWRILARLLWAFRIEHAVDEITGAKIEIDMNAFEESLTIGPKPFSVQFIPRSDNHARAIERELEAVSGLLKKWE